MKNRTEDENNSFLAMANGKKGARNRPSILGRLHGCPGLVRIELRQAERLSSGILAQILLVNDAILADQSVGKCLCGELKPLNYFRRPGVFLPSVFRFPPSLSARHEEELRSPATASSGSIPGNVPSWSAAERSAFRVWSFAPASAG